MLKKCFFRQFKLQKSNTTSVTRKTVRGRFGGSICSSGRIFMHPTVPDKFALKARNFFVHECSLSLSHTKNRARSFNHVGQLGRTNLFRKLPADQRRSIFSMIQACLRPSCTFFKKDFLPPSRKSIFIHKDNVFIDNFIKYDFKLIA